MKSKKIQRMIDQVRRLFGIKKGPKNTHKTIPTPLTIQREMIPPGKLLTNVNHAGVYATPAKRSVVFYRNSYYHFHYLAAALRNRGWDAIAVSPEDPAGPDSLYYHGEDINLYSSDPEYAEKNAQNLFEIAKERYKMFHFCGDHLMSFFPKDDQMIDPPDIIEWKNMGNKVAYTISGCCSATSKTAVKQWSMAGGSSLCAVCNWNDRPDVCSDERNLSWGRRVEKYCDIVFGEALPALDYIALPNVVREPTSMALDPQVWHPELDIPEEFLIPRSPEEILIYHGVGNYHLRTKQNGQNIKGTAAILAAIERLRVEGYPVRLIFETDKRNKDLRFTQAQVDIIVDELHAGRYGATSREGMMLGKPTITYINKYEKEEHQKLYAIETLPLISAKEATIYEILKDLVEHKTKRLEIGRESRQFALKWHSADACAERYEKIYDQVMRGEAIQYPTEWSYFEPVKRSAHLSSKTLQFQTV